MGLRRAVLALGWIALWACERPPLRLPSRTVAPADDAVEIAALLPETAERCVVARPRRLAERRRALVLFQTWAEPRAYAADLPIVAYASATAEGYGGRRARRTYIRFEGPADDLDARVRRLPVRWLDEPCEDRECRQPVARWVDERTLEIARYEWPRRSLPVSSAACVQLARTEPAAFEVAVDGTPRMGSLPVPEPRATRRVLSAQNGALRTRRELVFADPLSARVYESWSRDRASLLDATLMPLTPTRQTVERQDDRIVVWDERLWEELELALEDERLRRQALVLSRRRSEPTPLVRVDVDNLAVVRHQVGLRRGELSRLSGEARREAAHELATLLERASGVHPAELGWVRLLVRLELDLLGRPERAAARIDELLARGIAEDPSQWRLLRREALSQVSSGRLATALEADGVVQAPAARQAADDLVALREAGVPYEWAESAWSLSRRLAGRRSPRHRVTARLPWEGTLGALVGLAHLHDAPPHVTVQFAVHVLRETSPRAVGESRPELVVVRGPNGGSTIVGALPSTDLWALRRTGRALAALVEPGPLSLTVELRSPGSESAESFELTGELQGEDLVLRQVSDSLADVSWPAVGRYLARPLAELPTALFPPPELTIRAESAEVASELRRRAEPEGQASCWVAGPIVRCRSPGRPEHLGELLVRVARDRLASGTGGEP